MFQALCNGDIAGAKSKAVGFDWHATSDVWGTPLLAIFSGYCFQPEEADETMINTKTTLVKWCILQGADPHQHAPRSCNWKVPVGETNVDIAGNSALSFLANASHGIEMTLDETDYTDDERFDRLSDVESRLEFFSALISQNLGPPKVRVLEGVVSAWEKIYQDRAAADVVFVCHDAKECRAHSLVLKAVSPVLSAMLDQNSSWREAQHQKIETTDSLGAIENFVALVYTGSFAEGQLEDGTIGAKELIQIAEVAQRYQVEFLMPALTIRLRNDVSNATFDMICDFAIRHVNFDLQSVCMSHASSKTKRMSWAECEGWLKDLSPRVQALVSSRIGLQSAKRIRRTL